MDMKYLYELPKDMLVKIITTIEDETRRECEEEKMVALSKCERAHYTRCTICENFSIIKTGFIYRSGIVKIVYCDWCKIPFCKDHTDFIKKNTVLRCHNCKGNIHCEYLCADCMLEEECDIICDDCDQ